MHKDVRKLIGGVVGTLAVLGILVHIFVPGGIKLGQVQAAETKLPGQVWVYTAYLSPDYSQPFDVSRAAYAGLKVVGTEKGWLKVVDYVSNSNLRQGDLKGVRYLYVPPDYVSVCPIGATILAKAVQEADTGHRVDLPPGTFLKVTGCGNVVTLVADYEGREVLFFLDDLWR